MIINSILIVIGIVIVDCIFFLYTEFIGELVYTNQAYEKSKSTNKELLVIGNQVDLLIKTSISVMIAVIYA